MGCVFRPTSGDRRCRKGPPQTLSQLSPPDAEGAAAAPPQEDEAAKQSLYPSLSSSDSSGEEPGGGPLYRPYDEGDEDHRPRGDHDKSPNENPDPQIPDFQAIVLKLRENIASKRFRTRDREELTGLCAAGKYLHLMEDEDRTLLEARLRLFYLALCYGWKVAERDARALTASSVGIHVAPEALRSSRHQRKNLLAQNRVRAGMRPQRAKKFGDDFELV